MLSRIEKKDVPPELIPNCMKVCFNGEIYDADFFRYEFMYVSHDDAMNPEAFILCQEKNKDYIWLSYGGAVPSERGFKTVRNFKNVMDDLKSKYKRIGAQVENSNFAMLKIYTAYEFKIIGVRINHLGKTYIEFMKEN